MDEELYDVFVKFRIHAKNEDEAIKKALDCLKSDADYEMADIIGVE
jgi:hypothetical protein